MQTKTAAKGLALLMLTGTLAVAAPQAASASDYLDPCDLSTKIDELQGWGSDRANNVIVWKSGHQQSGYFHDIIAQGTVSATPCGESFTRKDYHWVKFRGDGEFVRQGDGGYRNWAFYGLWDRSDNVVKFHRW